MKRFLNLSSSESIDLHRSIYKNAIRIKRDAEVIISNRKSFSSATSLLILSSEEVVKATLVFLHSENYNIYKLKDAKKFFSDHRIRHQISQLIEMSISIYETSTIWEGRKKKPKVFNSKSNFWNNVVNGFFDIVEASKPLVNSIDRVNLLQEFNNIKNKGLYVDFKDELFTPQIDVQDEIYYKVKEVVDRVFKFYKIIQILHHPNFENRYPEENVGQLKKDLRLFIDDAMKEIDFEKLKKLKV
ncbi:MAG: AbiV family abortive infection protein [Lutibacter sp.]|uniref:AbiV family abortive infection protein n=1 Tax=Lutibacter sp. TaxID=1925666 RepID=UPI00385CBF3F